MHALSDDSDVVLDLCASTVTLPSVYCSVGTKCASRTDVAYSPGNTGASIAAQVFTRNFTPCEKKKTKHVMGSFIGWPHYYWDGNFVAQAERFPRVSLGMH